jgi:hypothetical protein
MIATIAWQKNDTERMEFSSVDDLLAELRKISVQTSAQRGIAAVLEKPSKQTMTVVMAGPHWGLNWFPENYNGCGSYHTIADTFDPDLNELPCHPDVATFYIFGHHSEIPLEHTISEEVALRGVREFLSATTRPTSLRWDLD